MYQKKAQFATENQPQIVGSFRRMGSGEIRSPFQHRRPLESDLAEGP